MSVRHDLLVLTANDLADLSNRGNVKRALKELDEGKVTFQLVDDGGAITVNWSDGPHTRLPLGRALTEAECDCPATGVCRHIVRAVLAYQRGQAAEGPQAAAVTGPWDPGAISDDVLAALYSARVLSAARATFDAGVVVETVRSEKPLARFHDLRHCVRFLVPGDPRYAQCDCAEPAPCRHVPLAVWGFRAAGDVDAALVATGPGPAPVDAQVLDAAEDAVRQLVERGLAHTPAPTIDRLRGRENELRAAGVLWPAEILLDLRRQHEHYHTHDARFSPDTLADLVGELLIRLDALRAPALPIPQLFVRGHRDDAEVSLGQARLIGLGCAVRHRQRSTEILALMQDDSSGAVAAISRHFPDPAPGDTRAPEDFSRLGAKLVVKGRDLATIGAGQLVIKVGKLYSDHRLSLGRSTASVYAQNYSWEDLRAPVLAVGFGELTARLAGLPPAALRPRRLGEDLYVVPVDSVQHARFSSRDQAVRASLRDASGASALLVHPYTTRSRHGTERLLHYLERPSHRLVFVAGTFRRAAEGLVVAPTGCVFESSAGRLLVQPWVDDMDSHLETADRTLAPPLDSPRALEQLLRELADAVGDATLRGIDDIVAGGPAAWLRLQSLGTALELHTIARVAENIAACIATRDRPGLAAGLLEAATLSRLGRELG